VWKASGKVQRADAQWLMCWCSVSVQVVFSGVCEIYGACLLLGVCDLSASTRLQAETNERTGLVTYTQLGCGL
jgi:hypothetical protein